MWTWSNTAKQYDERLCSFYSLQCVQQTLMDRLTLQPHTGWPQADTSRQTIPGKTLKAGTVQFVVTVHAAVVAVVVPESSAPSPCTVSWILVVVSVKSGELLAVLVTECITASITWVPRHLQPVVGRLSLDYEWTVLGWVPVAGVATWLEVKPQLIAAGQCQLTEQVVAKPVVASRVVETNFILRPRTVEDAGPVKVLLNQQWNAKVYRTYTPADYRPHS